MLRTRPTNQEIIGLDIAVDEVAFVHFFDPTQLPQRTEQKTKGELAQMKMKWYDIVISSPFAWPPWQPS